MNVKRDAPRPDIVVEVHSEGAGKDIEKLLSGGRITNIEEGKRVEQLNLIPGHYLGEFE